MIQITCTDAFQDIVKKRDIQQFVDIINAFLERYDTNARNKPLFYVFDVFVDPEACDIDPQLTIYYRDDDLFDIVAVIDEFSHALKKYLVDRSHDVGEFSRLRKLSDQFRFIMRREDEVSMRTFKSTSNNGVTNKK